MVYPSITARSLFLDSIPPLRRAARGNGLVTDAIIRALKRIARAAGEKDCEAIVCELETMAAETRGSAMLKHEIDEICDDIQKAISTVKET